MIVILKITLVKLFKPSLVQAVYTKACGKTQKAYRSGTLNYTEIQTIDRYQ